ncbi:hypothetical protein [Devosia sp.]|uniref:hypothetical protein n=1 Tax=Devosia sp. TaxID=1871048 RepID=UPI001AC947D5|nr:hypothetical protein [Devosia sp.]MBN9334914.1 hypothetical protein [Devosia sp.]
MFDDDEIKAEANRLRQSGWLNSDRNLTEQEKALKKLRTQRVPKKRAPGFGPMTGDVKTAAIWVASNIDQVSRPLRSTISAQFGMSYDDAGRVVAEAGRLLGREL